MFNIWHCPFIRPSVAQGTGPLQKDRLITFTSTCNVLKESIFKVNATYFYG